MVITLLYNLLWVALLAFTVYFAWTGFFGDHTLKGALSGKVKPLEPIKLFLFIGFGVATLIWFITDFLKGPDSSLWISKVGQWITDLISKSINPWAPEGASGIIAIIYNVLWILVLLFTIFFGYYGFLGDSGLVGSLMGKVKMTEPLARILSVAFGAALIIWSIGDFLLGPKSSLWVLNVGKLVSEILNTQMNPWQPK